MAIFITGVASEVECSCHLRVPKCVPTGCAFFAVAFSVVAMSWASVRAELRKALAHTTHAETLLVRATNNYLQAARERPKQVIGYQDLIYSSLIASIQPTMSSIGALSRLLARTPLPPARLRLI